MGVWNVEWSVGYKKGSLRIGKNESSVVWVSASLNLEIGGVNMKK